MKINATLNCYNNIIHAVLQPEHVGTVFHLTNQVRDGLLASLHFLAMVNNSRMNVLKYTFIYT